MIPIWLIEADVFGRSFEAVKAEIRHQGFVWDIVQPRSFLNGIVPVVGGHRLTDQDCVIFSGTYSLMRHIQLHHRWIPGGWCSAERFDCSSYYPYFQRHLFNRSHQIMTVDVALSQVREIFARFGRDDQVFVRPCGVQKTFTGRCVDREAFADALQPARYLNEPVLVASPREIAREWRAVVARGQFVAASQYKSEGQMDVLPGCPSTVRAHIENLLVAVAFEPDPIYVMDVCESGSELFLLELNSFSCSGLYLCDAAAVVKVVKELATEQWRRDQGRAASVSAR